jgi:mono/diheme cytochrome c family protein
MFKSSLLFFAVVLLAVGFVASRGSKAQAGAPAPAPAVPAQAPAVPALPPANPPGEALAPVQTVAPTPATPVKNPVKPTAESQAHAKSLYQIDCAICHGDNGNGKTDVAKSQNFQMADWTDPKTLAGKQDWELFNIIRTGKGTGMPAEPDGRAKDTDVWNLIIYIRTFSKGQPAPAAAPSGLTAQPQ